MLEQLQRLWNIILGKTDRALDQMEKPEDQINQFVQKLNKQVQEIESSVARALTDEKKMKIEIEQSLLKSQDWEKRAVLALEKGEESLAKECLLKKEDLDGKIIHMRDAWVVQKESTDKLKNSLLQQKEKVSDAKRQYNMMIARHQSAVAKKNIAEALSTNSTESPLAMIEKLNDKILRLESEAEAKLELNGGNLDGGDVESRIRELEREQKGDEALKRLKAKVSTGVIELTTSQVKKQG